MRFSQTETLSPSMRQPSFKMSNRIVFEHPHRGRAENSENCEWNQSTVLVLSQLLSEKDDLENNINSKMAKLQTSWI